MNTNIVVQTDAEPHYSSQYCFYDYSMNINKIWITILVFVNVIYLYMYHQYRNKILSRYLIDISNIDTLTKNIEILTSKIEKIENNKNCIIAKVGNTFFKFDEAVGSPSNFERRKILFTHSKPYHTFLAYIKAVCSYRLVENHDFKLLDTYNLIYNYIKEQKLIPETDITNDDILTIDLDDIMYKIKSSTDFEDEFRDTIIT